MLGTMVNPGQLVRYISHAAHAKKKSIGNFNIDLLITQSDQNVHHALSAYALPL
jgi:hypothetical protein